VHGGTGGDDPRLAAMVVTLHALQAASVFELAADGGTLQRVAAVGPHGARIYDRFPLGSALPVADVYRDGHPRYFERSDDWADYPISLRFQIEARGAPSVAVLPIRSGARIMGVLYAAFRPGTPLASVTDQLDRVAGDWLPRRAE
jgi:hypothetical protein